MDTLDIQTLKKALGTHAIDVDVDRGVLVVAVDDPNVRATVLEIVRKHTDHRHVAIELRDESDE